MRGGQPRVLRAVRRGPGSVVESCTAVTGLGADLLKLREGLTS